MKQAALCWAILISSCSNGCPRPEFIYVDWQRSVCPNPPQDFIRLLIEGETHDFNCETPAQRLDVSRWSGAVPVTVQIILPSGAVYREKHMNLALYPPQPNGDGFCFNVVF